MTDEQTRRRLLAEADELHAKLTALVNTYCDGDSSAYELVDGAGEASDAYRAKTRMILDLGADL